MTDAYGRRNKPYGTACRIMTPGTGRRQNNMLRNEYEADIQTLVIHMNTYAHTRMSVHAKMRYRCMLSRRDSMHHTHMSYPAHKHVRAHFLAHKRALCLAARRHFAQYCLYRYRFVVNKHHDSCTCSARARMTTTR